MQNKPRKELPKPKRFRKTNAECIDAAIKMELQKEKDRQSIQQEFIAVLKDLVRCFKEFRPAAKQ